MEVGAVKQAFNNELILLKKNLNQAKIQVIHKLTRKAKTLTEKNAPENLKEKLKRKAESAVSEVLILKKIKVKDLTQFMITHQGELNDYLNRPNVDHNKACARLLLHKALQEKYKHIRGRFVNVPIRDLFMSRQERLKLKKEAKEKQKNKKKGKNNKVVNSEGDWDVEDIKMGDEKMLSDDEDSEGEAEVKSDEGNNFELEENSYNDQIIAKVTQNDVDSADEQSDDDYDNNDGDDNNEKVSFGNMVRLKPTVPETIQIKENAKDNIVDINMKKITAQTKTSKILLPTNKNLQKKKDVHKNKNLNEKLLQRKFKKSEDEVPIAQNKVVDPFFVTATGENYLSVAEPRQPDKVKEVHKQGNRKLRRAVMFGHVPKIKPKGNNFDGSSRFRQNGFDKGDFRNKSNDRPDRKSNFNDNGNLDDKKHNDRTKNFNRANDEKPEKLHPSWEAKKKQSGILPYQGKKTVFDES